MIITIWALCLVAFLWFVNTKKDGVDLLVGFMVLWVLMLSAVLQSLSALSSGVLT